MSPLDSTEVTFFLTIASQARSLSLFHIHTHMYAIKLIMKEAVNMKKGNRGHMGEFRVQEGKERML